jgi:predicted ATP-dependent serine protease
MNVLTSTTNSNFTRASDVEIPDIYNRRFFTGQEDLDAVFGGQGFLPGTVFSLAGAPGAMKTTFLLQVLELLEGQGKKTAYISGEEGQPQLAFASKRLGVSNVRLANMTDIDAICDAIVEHKFDVVILDSMPALTSSKKLNKRQLEEHIVTKIVQTAKEHEIVIGTILHFRKDGSYKGSTLMPHSCDMNLIMQRNTEDFGLRDVECSKNRFGVAGFTSFPISSKGFTFEAVETERPGQSKKTTKRDLVVGVLDSEKTVAQIAQESGVSGSYLTTLMRDLVTQGAVQKNGRGAEATYKKK